MTDSRTQDSRGLSPGRGTIDQLFTLSQIFEGSWELAYPVYMCFVDLEKVYDRAPQGIVWEVLREYGVLGSLLRATRSLYTRSESCVRILSIKSSSLKVGVGLRQGSPLLFAVFLEKNLKAQSRYGVFPVWGHRCCCRPLSLIVP